MSELLKAIPGNHRDLVTGIAHAAATATEYVVQWAAPFDCRLKAVYFIPNADVSGQDTNTTHLNVDNKGSGGAGTTELGNVDLVNGTDLTGSDVNTLASGLTTDLSKDDVIAVEAEKVGTGLDVPAGTYVFEYDGG